MIAHRLDRLRHETRRIIALILARGRLHRIRYVRVAGTEIVLKSRRFGAGIAVFFGNLYLRLQCSDVEVLSDTEWVRWESAVERATNQGVVLPTPPPIHENFRGLVSRICPGVPLGSLLTDPARSRDEQFAAIRRALAALGQLHRPQVDWGNGLEQTLSHGDATVENVLVNMQSGVATWIDFDTRHLPQLSEPDRRADDLRALIGSAASHLPQSCYLRLAAEISAAQPDPATLQRFRHRLMTDWRRPNTFQLAQAPLSWTENAVLFHALTQSTAGA